MNNATYKITLDIHKREAQVFVSAFRGDTMRSIIASLTENGKPYLIPDNCGAELNAVLPNGEKIHGDCYIDLVTNSIVYDFTEHITVASGEVKCQLKLKGRNDGVLFAPTFTIVIEDNLFKDVESVEGQYEVSFPTENDSISYYLVPKDALNDLAQSIDEFTCYENPMTISEMPNILSSAKQSHEDFFKGEAMNFINKYYILFLRKSQQENPENREVI